MKEKSGRLLLAGTNKICPDKIFADFQFGDLGDRNFNGPDLSFFYNGNDPAISFDRLFDRQFVFLRGVDRISRDIASADEEPEQGQE
jgi:hypothetical protein